MKEWVVDGKCFVEPRAGTKNFLGNHLIESTGKWKRKTTGENDLEKAKDSALKYYLQISHLERNGNKVSETGQLVRLFNDFANEQRQHWIDQNNVGLGKEVYDSYIGILDNWIMPYFENVPLLNVDDDAIYEFELDRERKLGRIPAKSTINGHNCVFRAVFSRAKRKKYITSTQIPEFTTKGKGRKPNPRPPFMPNEIVRFEKLLGLC